MTSFTWYTEYKLQLFVCLFFLQVWFILLPGSNWCSVKKKRRKKKVPPQGYFCLTAQSDQSNHLHQPASSRDVKYSNTHFQSPTRYEAGYAAVDRHEHDVCDFLIDFQMTLLGLVSPPLDSLIIRIINSCLVFVWLWLCSQTVPVLSLLCHVQTFLPGNPESCFPHKRGSLLFIKVFTFFFSPFG